jgi:hypothetical protein
MSHLDPINRGISTPLQAHTTLPLATHERLELLTRKEREIEYKEHLKSYLGVDLLPALHSLLLSSCSYHATEAMCELYPERAREALLRELGNPDRRVRTESFRGLLDHIGIGADSPSDLNSSGDSQLELRKKLETLYVAQGEEQRVALVAALRFNLKYPDFVLDDRSERVQAIVRWAVRAHRHDSNL